MPDRPAPGGPFDLGGRLALVTGASAGIGFAIAEAMLDAGARVVLNGRDPGRLADAAAALAPRGKVATLAFDVTDADAADRAMTALAREHGQLDILVNNAAQNHRKPLAAFSDREWSALLATNLDAPMRLSRLALPGMQARRDGCIINLVSLASDLGRPDIVPYATSKGGLRMLTRALAVEVAPMGIRVNGIAPGFVATAMNAGLVNDPEFDAWVRRRTPLGRWAEAADIGGAAVFLASPAARYVTGHVLYVDGGFSASY